MLTFHIEERNNIVLLVPNNSMKKKERKVKNKEILLYIFSRIILVLNMQ